MTDVKLTTIKDMYDELDLRFVVLPGFQEYVQVSEVNSKGFAYIAFTVTCHDQEERMVKVPAGMEWENAQNSVRQALTRMLVDKALLG